VFCLYSSGLRRNVRRAESFSRHGGSSYAWIRRPDLTGYARPCDDKSIVFQSRFHAIFRLILGPRGRTDPMFLYSDPTWGSPYGSAQTIPLPLHLLDRRNSSTAIDFSIRTHSLDRWIMGVFTTSRGSPDSLYHIQPSRHLSQRSCWPVEFL